MASSDVLPSISERPASRLPIQRALAAPAELEESNSTPRASPYVPLKLLSPSPKWSAGPPASHPRGMRRGLHRSQWVGDNSILIEGLYHRAKGLQEQVKLVSELSEAAQVRQVSPLDDLVRMPYRAYGLQAAQPKSYPSRNHLRLVGFPARRPMTVDETRAPMQSDRYSGQDVLSISLPDLRDGQASRQMTYPSLKALSRLRTSLDGYNGAWGSNLPHAAPLPASKPKPGPPNSPGRLFLPPGRFSRSPNPLTPGEASFVSQFADGGLSRLDGPIRQTVLELDASLMRIHHLFRDDDSRDVEDQAAIVIQKVFRCWVAKRRYRQARWAIRAWHREELGRPRHKLLQWARRRQQQEAFVDMVRRCQARDLLRLAFKAWLANMEAIRHHVQGQERRAAVLHMQIRRTRAKDQLKRWLEVASGPRSRKACHQRHQLRSHAARVRLVKMAEEMGWTGNITDDMIRRELQNEAVSTLSTKVRMRTYRRVIEAWSKFSRVRRIAKGKHLESDRQYSRFVINRCFQAWRGKVLQKMEKWKIEGRDFRRRKLWSIARREGRTSRFRWGFRTWLRRVFTKAMMSRSLCSAFEAYREQVLWQRYLRSSAIERWHIISRDSIGYPFRCWVKYAAQQRMLRTQRLKMAGGMLYRYRRRLMVRSFNALKINAQSSRLVIEFPKAEHEADQYPKSPKTPVSGAASPSRTANPLPLREDSYDKLDSQLDDLMARRKNSYPRRFRTESRGVIFQVEPTAVMPLLKDAPASSDDSEKIMANLEKNVRVVLSTSLVDHEMEALRLRMFLQKIEHGIAECRLPSLTNETSKGPVDPEVSDDDRTVSLNATPLRKESGKSGNRSSGADSDGGKSDRRMSLVSRRSTKKLLSSGRKSGKSSRSTRTLSRHQRAFFEATERPSQTFD